VTDPLGRITAYGYDALDRQTGLTLPDPDGPPNGLGGGLLTSPVYAWSYDAIGRTLDATDPLNNEVAYAYALLWREVTSTLPDPDGGGPLDTDDVLAEYDGEGNLVSTTDELGRETVYAYDALNRLTSVTLPDPDGGGPLSSPVTQYQYDKASNLRFVIDPLGNSTEYVYDNLNRLITVLQADPDGGGPLAKPEWHTVYDAVGNVVAQIDAAGRLTKYEYDQLDRLVAVRQVDGAWPAAIVATTTQGGTANEVQRVGYSGAYGGTFTLSFSGQTTSSIAYNASASTVQAALEGLSNIGAGNVAVVQTWGTKRVRNR
jgi:YD repeat-containing protein